MGGAFKVEETVIAKALRKQNACGFKGWQKGQDSWSGVNKEGVGGNRRQ